MIMKSNYQSTPCNNTVNTVQYWLSNWALQLARFFNILQLIYKENRTNSFSELNRTHSFSQNRTKLEKSIPHIPLLYTLETKMFFEEMYVLGEVLYGPHGPSVNLHFFSPWPDIVLCCKIIKMLSILMLSGMIKTLLTRLAYRVVCLFLKRSCFSLLTVNTLPRVPLIYLWCMVLCKFVLIWFDFYCPSFTSTSSHTLRELTRWLNLGII